MEISPAYDNLLIVSGTGQNSGKTQLACKLIDIFRDYGIRAVKISPHFHAAGPGLELISESSGSRIFREQSEDGIKDSSRMLLSGASEVFYIQSDERSLLKAFNSIYSKFDPATPFICESPALAEIISPGVLFIADGRHVINRKNRILPGSADHIYNDERDSITYITEKLAFSGGRWIFS